MVTNKVVKYIWYNFLWLHPYCFKNRSIWWCGRFTIRI